MGGAGHGGMAAVAMANRVPERRSQVAPLPAPGVRFSLPHPCQLLSIACPLLSGRFPPLFVLGVGIPRAKEMATLTVPGAEAPGPAWASSPVLAEAPAQFRR